MYIYMEASYMCVYVCVFFILVRMYHVYVCVCTIYIYIYVHVHGCPMYVYACIIRAWVSRIYYSLPESVVYHTHII